MLVLVCLLSRSADTDVENKLLPGVEVAGKIRVDFTHLRTEGYLKPEHQLVGPEGPYYKVDYELRMIVNGRNLRYDVRCDGLTQQAGEISIAAAFVPGTE